MKAIKQPWLNKEVDTTIHYEIEYDTAKETATLYSIVGTNFGGPATNFVCEGTLEYCTLMKEKLENEH